MRLVRAIWRFLVGLKDALVLLLLILFFGALYALLAASPNPAISSMKDDGADCAAEGAGGTGTGGVIAAGAVANCDGRTAAGSRMLERSMRLPAAMAWNTASGACGGATAWPSEASRAVLPGI